MPKALDLVGQRFGHLEVMHKNGKNKNGKVLWHCRCHNCGNEKDIPTQCLTKGESKSCGCGQHKLNTHHDLEGKHINSLTVIKYVGKSKWECKCDCGNITTKPASDLLSGRAKSCGKCTKEDLVGMVFNNLQVIAKSDIKNHRVMWKCKCLLCGNICEVSGYRLKSGKAVSCGCARHKNEALSLVGQTFGKLTVISREENSNDRSMWKCKCDCGNEVVVSGKHLLSGNTKSCGCLKKEHKYIDLTGKQYGLLTVLELDHIDNNRVFWKCFCNGCGNIKVVNGGDMKMGKIHSCGCINVAHSGSKAENEIRDFVSKYAQTEKARNILDGKEIDIFIPSLSLGIEYNGSAVHASKNNPFVDKYYLYHRDKFLLAKEKGIHLISIFDVDWENNQDKIKMYLYSLLVPQKRLMARQCEVIEIDDNTACNFVDKYHIQGSNNAMMKINYGLYYNNELYAVMSFGKLRLSRTKYGQFELHRYCVKDGYTIVGGANKLLKAFEREYNPKYILSYSDNDYFVGGIYERLGFTNKGQCKPRYYWYLNGLEIKRERCMIKNLRQLYTELLQEAYDMGAANKEDYVMTKLGACKVYRSGNTKWER